MFGTKTKTKELKFMDLGEGYLKEVDTKPQPTLVVVSKDDPIDEYDRLANKLGFSPGDLLRKKLLRFLSSQNISVYDYEEVFDYLTGVVKKDNPNTHWVWKPLREKDSNRKSDWVSTGHGRNGGFDHGYFRKSTCPVYNHIVPMDILQRVDAIETEFPDTFGFFVSDYQSKNPDPFIVAVTFSGNGAVIFGMWDEPGFGKVERSNDVYES